jgi:hypothetical protein
VLTTSETKISGDMSVVLKHTITNIPLNGRTHLGNINNTFAENHTVPLVQASSKVQLNAFFTIAKLRGVVVHENSNQWA